MPSPASAATPTETIAALTPRTGIWSRTGTVTAVIRGRPEGLAAPAGLPGPAAGPPPVPGASAGFPRPAEAVAEAGPPPRAEPAGTVPKS